jgi:formiminotetrahydrofolate cyclodeaminase
VHVGSATLGDLLAGIAAKTPAPGGGAAACVGGALAASLASMVVSYSLGRKNLAEHQPALERAAAALVAVRAEFLALAEEDARAYAALNEAMRLPEGDERRARDLAPLTRAAADAPARCVEAAAALLRLMGDLPGITNRHLRSDLAGAAAMAEGAARAARWNVVVNAPGLDAVAAGEGARLLAMVDRVVAEAREVAAAVERACE